MGGEAFEIALRAFMGLSNLREDIPSAILTRMYRSRSQTA